MEYLRLLDIEQAAACVQGGGVIAYPTEAVFGLGCDPAQENAVSRLLNIKQRAPEKGLILIAANLPQLHPYIADLSAQQQDQLHTVWPGPVTFVVPARATTSQLLTGGRDTIAVRVSAHPRVAELCLAAGCALVSSSANLSNHPPIRQAHQLTAPPTDSAGAHLASQLDGVLDGVVGGLDQPTAIYDLNSGQQLRQGSFASVRSSGFINPGSTESKPG